MAKKFDFDWKNFLLQKGERVGLYAALGIMGLMLAFGLFWPGSGIFSGSSSANARALADLNQAASNALANNKPTGADAEDTVTDPKYKQAGDLELASVSRPSTGYFAPFEREETRRRRPIIDKPDEWQSTIVLAALKSFMFKDDGKRIGVVERKEIKPSKKRMTQLEYLIQQRVGQQGGRGINPSQGMFQQMQGPPGGGGGRGGNMPGGSGPGSMPASMQNAGRGASMGLIGRGNQAKEVMKLEWADLDTLGKNKDLHLAIKVMPLHVVVWEGSFPMKRQLEEFRKALHLNTLAEAWPELKFRGFEVQRRQMRSDGKFEPWSDAQRLPLADDYKKLLVLSGRDVLRPEEEKIETEVLIPGLYMPLLRQIEGKDDKFKDKNYDKVIEARDKNLTLLAECRKEIQKNSKKDDASEKREEFKEAMDTEVFSGEADKPSGDGKKPPAGAEVKGLVATDKKWEPPDYCLLRFIDARAEAGKTYQYRLQIKTLNPNYGKDPKNLVHAAVGEGKFLSSAWIELDTVTIPPDFHVYAVDEKELDKDIRSNVLLEKGQAVVQFQTWLEDLTSKGGQIYPVGDWAVADRLIVRRGEYVGGVQAVKLPVWDILEDDYRLAIDPARAHLKKIDVEFSSPDASPLLINVEPGKPNFMREVPREDAKPLVTRIEDKDVPTELLFLTPEGKLIVRSSDLDKKDKAREDRYQLWKKRVKAIEGKSTRKRPGDPMEDVFKKDEDKKEEK